MDTLSKETRYLRAKEKVQAEKGFYSNLTAYCIIIPMLAIFNYTTTGFVWVIFPAMGWGLGVVLHGMQVFGYNPFLGKNWEEKRLKEYMSKEG
ncbi:2TM domain-containing protein [uncultured Maribacter sp.]|uniref:2TM domain-containing protein n=1 Tax=uncultured Maribacter sp. TaxID=431308 RepID=UPI0026329185|nr:2TM domain-containing protein [uncultured Maribacter sp.]